MAALESASARYLLDPSRADALRQECAALARAEVAFHLPECVLLAHWDTIDGMRLLRWLSATYRIVPPRLWAFLAHCRAHGHDMLDFVHPCSLFDDPVSARLVYVHMGRQPATLRVLSTARYLCSSHRSTPYGSFLWPMLHLGLRDGVGDQTSAHLLCSLGCRCFSRDELSRVSLVGVGRLLRDRRTSGAATHLMLRMTPQQRMRLAEPLAHAAAMSSVGAMQFIVSLARDAENARAIAAAVIQHGYRPYVMQLSMPVLWRIVPYLVRHRARAVLTLRRLAAGDGPRARQHGIFTALLSLPVPVPPLAALPDPRGPHDVVHLLSRGTALPPDLRAIDRAMDHGSVCAEALRKISRYHHPLRRYLAGLARWRRRGHYLLALIHARTCACPVLRELRAQRPWVWRRVLGFL